jgi:DNA-binding MarR family transcriptional regulator
MGGVVTGELAHFATNMLKIRKWERANLPLLKPQIALDVLLYSMITATRSYPRPTKEVHLEIGYSQDRVRETIGMLVCDNWLAREPCLRDRRIVCLHPTDRAISLMREYEKCTEVSITPRE